MTINDILKSPDKREVLIDVLCKGITNTSDFRDALDYIIFNKMDSLNIPEFTDPLYEDEEDILELILPTFRRVWGRIYVQIPDILKNKKDKIELYQANFDIDEFIDYLKNTFLETKGCLSKFEYLDRTTEHLTIIVDNYIAMLIKNVSDSDDIKSDIRNLKIKKLIK